MVICKWINMFRLLFGVICCQKIAFGSNHGILLRCNSVFPIQIILSDWYRRCTQFLERSQQQTVEKEEKSRHEFVKVNATKTNIG